jgi:hypothetical protein
MEFDKGIYLVTPSRSVSGGYIHCLKCFRKWREYWERDGVPATKKESLL